MQKDLWFFVVVITLEASKIHIHIEQFEVGIRKHLHLKHKIFRIFNEFFLMREKKREEKHAYFYRISLLNYFILFYLFSFFFFYIFYIISLIMMLMTTTI